MDFYILLMLFIINIVFFYWLQNWIRNFKEVPSIHIFFNNNYYLGYLRYKLAYFFYNFLFKNEFFGVNLFKIIFFILYLLIFFCLSGFIYSEFNLNYLFIIIILILFILLLFFCIRIIEISFMVSLNENIELGEFKVTILENKIYLKTELDENTKFRIKNLYENIEYITTLETLKIGILENQQFIRKLLKILDFFIKLSKFFSLLFFLEFIVCFIYIFYV